MYVYFVGYAFQDDRGNGSGNLEVSVPNPIGSIDDVYRVQDYLRSDRGLQWATVTGYSLLREEP
jgi:hypothetical protein